ncbi:gliding motility-associated C-terminal domain-containing protein, partial [Flavobacterium sp. '19STA2R22 D10 B1']|uniref:gliding motility-associated C-terminal domain-containing protein n=2 Tax=Flavobacterium aerium TaxID=3037261 RepID=UPI00278C136F
PLATTTALVDGATYYASQTADSCESATRLAVTVVITKTEAPTTTQTTQTFCEIDNTTIASLNVTGTQVQWYASATSTTPLATTTALVDGTTYYASQTADSCESATRLAVTVVITKTEAPTTSETTQTFCEIDNTTIASLQVTGTQVQWYASATSTTPLATTTALVDGATYYASQTADSCESATRLAVTVVITKTEAPTTTQTTQTFCEIDNTTIASLQVTGTQVQWYASATSTTPLATTTALVDGATYYASQTADSCESASRLAVTVVITKTEAPTTSETTQTFCEIDNTTIASLDVTGTQVQWYASATSTTPLATTTALVDGATYYASQTADSCESATRLAVTVVITKTEAPTTSETTQTFCEIDNTTIASLNVTGTQVQWYASATSTTALATTTALVDGATYYASQTADSCESATRLAVTVVITKTEAPTTSETTQTFCEIDNTTIASLNVTGTQVQWYASATSTTPLATTAALVDGATYYASQTADSCESATRLAVTVVITKTEAPTTSETTQTFCEIDNTTIASLNVTGTQVQWYASATSTTALATTTALVDGAMYYASQTADSCESATRLAVTVVITKTEAPTTSETTQTFCEIDNTTIASLQVTGTQVQWYASATSTTALATTTALVDGATYYASQTADACESATRLAVTVVITKTEAPTTSETTQTFCEIDNTTIASLQVTGTQVQWYASATSTTALATTTALVDGATYYASQTADACESATRLAVTVVITKTEAPTTSETTQTFCEIDNTTIASLNVTGTQVQWYASATSTTALATTTALVDGTTYYASQTANGCESASRLEVTIVITKTEAPTTTQTTQTFCEIDNTTIASLQVTGTQVQWYASATSTTALATTTALVDGATYYASQTADSCESATRLAVTVVITKTEAPTTSETTQTFCEIDNTTIASLQVTGIQVQWYASATSTTALATTTALVDGATYYASQTANGCESASRLEVTVVITKTEAPTTTEATQTFCESDGATIVSLNVTGTQVQWYASATSTTALATTTALVDGATYYASQTADSCESATRLAVTVIITKTPIATILPTVTIEGCDTAAITGLVYSETAVNITVAQLIASGSSITNGTSVASISYIDTQSGSCPTVVTRVFTIKDLCGNPTTVTQVITIKDTQAPILQGTLTAEINVNCSTIPLAPALQFTDNCSGVLDVIFDEETVNQTATSYSIIRTWMVTDVCGNVAEFTQKVNVINNSTTTVQETELCINDVTVSLFDYLPGVATTGVWIDVDNSTGLQGSSFDPSQVALGDYTLRYILNEGPCQTVYEIKMNVNDDCIVLPACTIKVYNAVSPDGDGRNDFFMIDGILCFPKNTVEIYNRWGVRVYEAEGYDNNTKAFRGYSDGRVTVNRASELPEGTYYYILKYQKEDGSTTEKAGYLYINR